MELTITRRDSTTYKVNISSGEVNQGLLNADVVNLNIVSTTSIDFKIDDQATILGRRYRINRLPQAVKSADNRYSYTVEMEGEMYNLLRAQFLLFDDTGIAIEGDFSYMATLEDVIRLMAKNLNRVFGVNTYIVGTFPTTEARNHSFSSENCLSVLQRICSNYEQEFDLIYSAGATTINIGAVGSVKSFALKYGAGNGLYELERQAINDKNVFTRLFVYGSERNLKADYRNFSRRLKLPLNDESVIQDAAAITAMGVIEHTKIFDEIFPHRTGIVSTVTNISTFTDSGMDFDLNASSGGDTLYLIAGNPAKVKFNTGNLAGYEFEILSYNHSTKTFVLKKYKDDRGMEFPAAVAFEIQPGDEYVLLDITMPQTYVDAAEGELLTKATEYLNQGKVVKAKYACKIDPIYAKTESLSLSVGDYVPVVDAGFNIDRNFRVISLTRDIIEPYKWTVDLGDEVEVSYITQLFQDRIETNKLIQLNRLKDPAVYRNSWKTTKELQSMIFDQEDYFDTENIKPLSIETSMLSVGSKAGQFVLNGIVFQPSFNAVANRIVTTAGTLSHYAIEDNIRTWNISAYDLTLPDNNARYIYAKCAIGTNLGEIRYSTSQLKVDAEAGFYNFLIGVLHSVLDGYRKTSLTYGSTTINGKEIKTGRISSQDGSTYFDLDAGEFRGNLKFTSGASVQESVNSKKRVFITQPTTPYEAGDLWSQGTAGELMRCNITRLTGSYTAADWGKAVKYTDDTAVNNLEIGGRNYISHNPSNWEQGTIAAATGQNVVTTNRIRTIGYVDIGNSGIIALSRILQSDTLLAVLEYDASYLYLGTLSDVVWQSTFPSVHQLKSGSKYLRFILARSGGQNIDTTYLTQVKLKFEKGNKATDWTPAPEDVQAQINAFNYLKTAMQNSTDIQGGLLSTTLIKLGAVNQSGTWIEKAGINGAGTTDSTPRLYAGGTLQQAINRIAGMISNAAKFVVTQGGKIYGMEVELFGSFSTAPPGGKRIHISHEAGAVNIHDEAGVVKTTITSESIPTLASLLSPNSASVNASQSISLSAMNNSSGDTKFSATLNLPSSASNYTITTPPIELSVSAGVIGSNDSANAGVAAYLIKPDLSEILLGGGSANANSSYPSDSQILTIPSQVFSGMPHGAYRIKLTAGVSATAEASSSANISINSPNNLLEGVTVVDVSRILRDGMFIIKDANNFSYLNPSGIVEKSQVAPDRPGVLLSGRGLSGGGAAALWGPKKHATLTVTKNSTGTYTVYHSIGHDNFSVQVSPMDASRNVRWANPLTDRFTVYTYNGTTLSDANFSFTVFGDN